MNTVHLVLCFQTTYLKQNLISEENGVIGNSNIVENISSFNFNENNNLSFKTRQNRKLNMAEYYNLIYDIRMIAYIMFMTKLIYEDKDLVPSENLMFKLTLIPITTINNQYQIK